MILYDAETKYLAKPKNPDEVEEGVTYAKSWGDKKGMGISCLVAYDYACDRWHVFADDNKDEFEALLARSEIYAGYNNHWFDDSLVAECWGDGKFPTDPEGNRSYDLLRTTLNASGRRFKLDEWAMANLGYGKSGHGADAPKLWQTGQIGKLINYNMDDVRILKGLMDKVLNTGMLIDPGTKKLVRIQRPQ